MKVNKTQAVLYIFNTLLSQKTINKNDIMSEFDNMDDLKFKRYIQEIRAFLVNFCLGYELIYDRKDNVYFLQKY